MHINRAPSNICFLEQTFRGFPWRLLQTLSHSHDVIFYPDPPWPATAIFKVILCTFRLPEFVQEVLYCDHGWRLQPGKSLRNCRWDWTNEFVAKMPLQEGSPTFLKLRVTFCVPI